MSSTVEHDSACGQARHTAGRPAAGAVKANGLWFCSWLCVMRHAEQQLGGTIEQIASGWRTAEDLHAQPPR